MKKIYIEYPITKTWKILSILSIIFTYLSIITVIIGSYFKDSPYYISYIFVSEVIFSFFFFIDYFIRLYYSWFSWKFIKNPFSIADLLSFLPIFIWIIIWFNWYNEVFNIFRLCRVLRIFRVWKYLSFLKELRKAVEKNLYKYKIAFTLFFVVWLIWSFLIYSVENAHNPKFAHIPDAMWRAIVTMSTLWYWDIYPISILWKLLAVVIIIFWPIFLSIITSITIITFLDVVKLIKKDSQEYICESCLTPWHTSSDNYCRICGTRLYK